MWEGVHQRQSLTLLIDLFTLKRNCQYARALVETVAAVAAPLPPPTHPPTPMGVATPTPTPTPTGTSGPNP